MVFLLNLAFAMGLIALGVGVSLLVWAFRNEGRCIGFTKVFGFIILILAILTLLCTIFHGTTYWRKGYYRAPMAHMMMRDGMRDRMNQRRMQRRQNMMDQSGAGNNEQ